MATSLLNYIVSLWYKMVVSMDICIINPLFDKMIEVGVAANFIIIKSLVTLIHATSLQVMICRQEAIPWVPDKRKLECSAECSWWVGKLVFTYTDVTGSRAVEERVSHGCSSSFRHMDKNAVLDEAC